MNSQISIGLAVLLLGFLVADLAVFQWGAALYMVQKLLGLIDVIVFWR